MMTRLENMFHSNMCIYMSMVGTLADDSDDSPEKNDSFKAGQTKAG